MKKQIIFLKKLVNFRQPGTSLICDVPEQGRIIIFSIKSGKKNTIMSHPTRDTPHHKVNASSPHRSCYDGE